MKDVFVTPGQKVRNIKSYLPKLNSVVHTTFSLFRGGSEVEFYNSTLEKGCDYIYIVINFYIFKI